VAKEIDLRWEFFEVTIRAGARAPDEATNGNE
jgi:hypothetical protein